MHYFLIHFLPFGFDDFATALKLTNVAALPDGAVVCSEHFDDNAYVKCELRRVASSNQILSKPPRAPRLKDDAMPSRNVHCSVPDGSPDPTAAVKKRASANRVPVRMVLQKFGAAA
jgi:hypothetical protein